MNCLINKEAIYKLYVFLGIILLVWRVATTRKISYCVPAKACCPAAEKMQSWLGGQGNHHHKHLENREHHGKVPGIV